MLFKILTSRKSKAFIFSLLDCWFKKDTSKIVFVVKDRTEFSGNLRVVAETLLKDNKHKIYIYKDGIMVPDIKACLENKGATILEGWSKVSIYHLLTSGIFIFSHAPRDANITKRCKQRIVINLWHGVAFKTIENLMPNIHIQKQRQLAQNAKLYDYIIASSKTDQETNAKAFMVPTKKVKITGLPRYELLKSNYPLDTFLSKQRSDLLLLTQNRPFILYAPTFREQNISAIDQISDEEWKALEKLLQKYNAIMGIRPHSYDTAEPLYIKNNPNFCWLSQTQFTESNLILQFTDILVVDFSSIWIDFLLLNRPIVGFAKDFQHYLHKERGFVYDFSSTFPNTFHTSTESLIHNIEELIINKNFTKHYNKALTHFHKYPLETHFMNHFTKMLKL